MMLPDDFLAVFGRELVEFGGEGSIGGEDGGAGGGDVYNVN